MGSRSKKVDHEYALLGQGVDHQMGLIEKQRRVAGTVGPGPLRWHTQGIEAGSSRGGNKKPADHLHVPEAFGGNAG